MLCECQISNYVRKCQINKTFMSNTYLPNVGLFEIKANVKLYQMSHMSNVSLCQIHIKSLVQCQIVVKLCWISNTFRLFVSNTAAYWITLNYNKCGIYVKLCQILRYIFLNLKFAHISKYMSNYVKFKQMSNMYQTSDCAKC